MHTNTAHFHLNTQATGTGKAASCGRMGGEGGGHTLSVAGCYSPCVCVIGSTVVSGIVGLLQSHPVLTQLDLGGHRG